jgi:hypothetical protein
LKLLVQEISTGANQKECIGIGANLENKNRWESILSVKIKSNRHFLKLLMPFDIRDCKVMGKTTQTPLWFNKERNTIFVKTISGNV